MTLLVCFIPLCGFKLEPTVVSFQSKELPLVFLRHGFFCNLPPMKSAPGPHPGGALYPGASGQGRKAATLGQNSAVSRGSCPVQ